MTISTPAVSDADVDVCAAASSPMQYIGGNNWIRVEPRRSASCRPGNS
jgi:hypothetical protein